MKLSSIAWVAGAVLAMVSPSAMAATKTEKPKYICEDDDYCESNFPGTVCIAVDNYGIIIRKCTPNTPERPACRGAVPGLCPSYQSAEVGYLNVHCVFVAKDAEGTDVVDASGGSKASSDSKASSKASSSSGSGSGVKTTKKPRYLLASAVSKASSGSGAAATTPSVGDGSSTKAPTSTAKAGKFAKVKIGNETVIGEFKCVDVSDCENQAYDKSTCEPTACGSPNSKMQCNNRGTCSYPSIQTMKRRKCMCYAGFGGEKCEKSVSKECDVDCGYGGDCVEGSCVCKKGFDGKLYKGKKATPDKRCEKCTNDLGCQNGNSCDVESGTCVCGLGYSGPTCGATEDSCVKTDCGPLGTCEPAANGTAICKCKHCLVTCDPCKNNKDCSTCPSPASTIAFSKPLMMVSALVAVLLGQQLL